MFKKLIPSLLLSIAAHMGFAQQASFSASPPADTTGGDVMAELAEAYSTLDPA